MNKDEIVDAMAAKADITKKAAGDALEAMLDAIVSTLKKGDSVAFTGFGTFHASQRKARQGINPKTGEKLQIPAMRVAKFKPGKGLKDAVR